MITLDELLIKIGVDGEQAQKIGGYVDLLQNGADKIGEGAKEINKKLDNLLGDVSASLDSASVSADKASKELEKAGKSADKSSGRFQNLKLAVVASVGALMLFGNKIASAFNGAIANAQNLFKTKDALYQISQDEIAQVERYQQSLKRTSLSIDSVKTKIAINLLPAITSASEKINDWLIVNKDFITNGITKIVEWLGNGVQVIGSFIKFIDKVVRSTIGWKNALIVLTAVWAVLNRSFLMSPMGMIIMAFGALLLLVDDLITHMEGGESLFGDYWNPLIDGARKVIGWFKSLSETTQKVLGASGVLTLAMIFFGGTAVKMFGKIVTGVKFATTAFRAFSLVVMSNPIIAILTAIAVIAYLIYDNWDWLSAKFKEIWGNISKWATEAWDTIKNTVADAIKDVLMKFGLTEDEAERVVNSLKNIFEKVFSFITSPFTRAFDLVKKLFKIWNDDSKSSTEKFKESFKAVYDFIVDPFKTAMKWIRENFGGFIDTVVGGAVAGLNYLPGVDIEYKPMFGDSEESVYPTKSPVASTMGVIDNSVNSPSYDNSSVYSETNNYQGKNDDMLAVYGAIASVAEGVNVPSPVNNTSVRNDVRFDSKIEIHTTDSLDGAKKAGDYLVDQIGKASDFNKSAVRG